MYLVKILVYFTIHVVDRDSSVGIESRHVLDGPGIETLDGRGGDEFSTPVQSGCGAHPAFYTTSSGSFPGVKRPGRCVNHPPPSRAEVKERVELNLYSPSVPSWQVIGRNLSWFISELTWKPVDGPLRTFHNNRHFVQCAAHIFFL